ncbi:MAG TPA: serine--tRNA ligase [Alphaproteobacteria bacterium]|nr:serine--tRNA ligase [Alphaproteobacteria bacterium]HNS45342.1 serine--tRNA ligase [Alphaproteobacteria bacterium]
MHDLKALRDNPDFYDRNWARRGLDPQTPTILKIDEERRALQTELQSLQTRRNEASKEIGAVKSKGGDAQALMDEVAAIKDKMVALEEQERVKAEQLNDILSALPNMIADDVPDGPDEEHNVEVRRFGTPKVGQNAAKDHVEIGEALGLMDFETAAKVAGARFVIEKGGIARLERALAQFMLDTHTQEHGYTEVNPPLLVSDDVMYGTTQLPKFRDDQFGTTDGRWLIPTSEVVLTNMVRESILEEGDFPIRMCAHTPCFRKEAGSAGKDTRGIIRQHQFYKVEMVSIVKPEDSEKEHQRMTECAENILKKLEIPFRTIVLCSGDMGFASRKTYDIEAWIPSQNKYREISSCSNCGDIQARRMKARFKRAGAKDTEFVHTLNGSGVAVGRALVAVMENYYDPTDGGIFVPEVLKPYMGGVTKIVKGR